VRACFLFLLFLGMSDRGDEPVHVCVCCVFVEVSIFVSVCVLPRARGCVYVCASVRVCRRASVRACVCTWVRVE